MQTIRSQNTSDAKSATLEETADNLSCFATQLQQQAIDQGFRLMFSMDNAPIHNVKPEMVNFGQTSLLLPHPANSPDLHQVVEHRFADMKQHVVTRMYQVGFDTVQQNPALLQQFVLEYCQTITPQLIESELENLVKCYQVVACPGYSAVVIDGKNVEGVGGNWPRKGLR